MIPSDHCISVQHTQSFFITSFKSEFVVDYLKDCSIGDHVDKVIKDFLILEADASKLGLHLNRSKCEIIGILDFSRAQLKEKGILLNETDSAAACLLGSPLHMDGISQLLKPLQTNAPCFDNEELINYNDLRHMLSKILNIDLSDDGWEQA